MIPNIPDHPEIANTLKTGYPRLLATITCASCHTEISGDRMLYNYGGVMLCEKCFVDHLLENEDANGFADAFGIETIEAGRYLEYLRGEA